MFGLSPWPFVLALVVFCAGGATVHHFDAKKYNALAAEFNQYKGAAAEMARRDFRLKEIADAEAARRATVARADIARLRQQRDAATPVFTAPPASKCPDEQVCFDRAEFVAARRNLVEGVRRGADEGTAVENDMAVVQEWAAGQ